MIARLKKSEKRAPFIVLEGGEGSGKSSLLIALKDAFGDRVYTTREPGGSPYAELIRTAALKNPLAKTAPAETTLCLMFGARFDNVANALLPKLSIGMPIIADRFDASSYAYQVHAQTGGALESVFWGLRERLLVLPSLYIFIDVAPEEGWRRANSRNQRLPGAPYDHFDDREVAFHAKVREGYLAFFSKLPKGSYAIVDGNRPLAEVKKDVIRLVEQAVDNSERAS